MAAGTSSSVGPPVGAPAEKKQSYFSKREVSSSSELFAGVSSDPGTSSQQTLRADQGTPRVSGVSRVVSPYGVVPVHLYSDRFACPFRFS